jgi:hypothetical protein
MAALTAVNANLVFISDVAGTPTRSVAIGLGRKTSEVIVT